ncbi:MAG TPA: ubiquinol-cytochrome c reductase cytochrome b subunit [Acidimicrobiia bacterium]|jgi:ubiquinol-cytochrome c reductase cytochrome b subunit|nr:ubiquinol-cytochrome c reductase cytochrome b subunit [Acidimicrobiia bacterium]
MIARLNRWLDERLGSSRAVRKAVNKAFPDHWSFMLGEIAMYSLVVLILTGIYLTFFFNDSQHEVIYHGSYKALDGVRMTEAYESVVHLSFDVRAGLVMRQIHHWAALVFLAAIVAHLCRIFFTGAFRKPRELNWIVGVTLLLLALGNGFAGYSLPDDLLSGTGLRVANAFMLSIPLIGPHLAFFAFNGEFPGTSIISRLYIIHVLIFPALIVALLSAHLAILWHQKHTQFRGPEKRERNVVGNRLWPTYTAKSIGLFAIVAGVLSALGGLAQINPIWLYGPYDPAAVSTAAQPDWYLGWTEGAIRIFPPWFLHIGHYGVPEVFWPSIALPGLTFALLYAWPFLERRFTHDTAEHHLLDRPRDRPVRTAIGVGVLMFYVVLLVAGAQDLFAQWFNLSILSVTRTLQVLVFALPLASALVTWKLCRDLGRAEPRPWEEDPFEPDPHEDDPVAPEESPITIGS